VIDTLPGDQVVLCDGLGYELVVDLGSDQVTIYLYSEGPEVVLPADLSFACPSDLYLGTWVN
jgi:hypothetical protein